MTRRERILLGLLVLAALAIRLPGITRGLPGPGRSLSYYADESNIPLMLSGMDPLRGRWYPDSPRIGQATLQPLLVGGACALLSRAGWVRVEGGREHFARHPEDLAPVYLVGRLLSALQGAVTAALALWAARALFGARAGWMAGLLAATLHVPLFHARLALMNVPVAFWWMLSACLMIRVAQGGGSRSAAAAGLALGLAVATKLTALAALPALALACALRRPFGWRPAAAAALGAVAGLLAGFPALLRHPGLMAELISLLGTAHGVGGSLSLPRQLGLYVLGVGLPFALLSAAALWPRRGSRLMMAQVLPPFVLICLSSNASVGRMIPVFLLMTVPVAGLLEALARRWRAGAAWGLAAALALHGLLRAAPEVELMRRPDLRDFCAAWTDRHLPPLATVGLLRYAYFAGPQTLYQDWKGLRRRTRAVLLETDAEVRRARPEYLLESDLQRAAYPPAFWDWVETDYAVLERLDRPRLAWEAFYTPAPESDLNWYPEYVRVWRRRAGIR